MMHEWELDWKYLLPLFVNWGYLYVDVFTFQGEKNRKCKYFCCRDGKDLKTLRDSLLNCGKANSCTFLLFPLLYQALKRKERGDGTL